MNYSKIAGTGSYLPERIVTNSELQTTIETMSGLRCLLIQDRAEHP